MAQKLREDKIGTLQHSAGNIQMIASLSNPAYLTIGGQQYKITSTLVVALPAMSANTRYQVFAVQSGGVVSLVISQNENSVGPAGYTRWKLVGSLYSNGMSPVAFGSFVNIKGVPRTEKIPFIATTQGFGTISSETSSWSRDADILKISSKFTCGTVQGVQARFTFPGSLTAKGSSIVPILGQAGVLLTGNAVADNYFLMSEPNVGYFTFSRSNGGGFNAGNGSAIFNNSEVEAFEAHCAVSQWSITAIEDL